VCVFTSSQNHGFHNANPLVQFLSGKHSELI
jgi:hypothetical protein